MKGAIAGAIVGITIASVFGVRTEMARGESDPSEILQWGITFGVYVGLIPGALLGALVAPLLSRRGSLFSRRR
jgi:hypothetical protein